MNDESESLPPDLLRRLWQLGGVWTGQIDRFGFFEILTPAGAFDKYVWCTESGLAAMLDDWEAKPGVGGPRLAVMFGVAAGTIRPPE